VLLVEQGRGQRRLVVCRARTEPEGEHQTLAQLWVVDDGRLHQGRAVFWSLEVRRDACVDESERERSFAVGDLAGEADVVSVAEPNRCAGLLKLSPHA